MSPRKLTLPTGEVRTVPRVTEIIDAGMRKPELEEWKLRDLASFASANPHSDPDVLLTRWRGHSRRHADRGSAVHAWIEAFLTGRPLAPSPQLAGYVQAFRGWYLKHGPSSFGDAEQMLTDHDVTVCGTADYICDGHLYDWKTAEKRSDHPPWPDHVAQIGAYCSMSRCVDDDGYVGPLDWRRTTFRAASIVRLYADGTFKEDVYSDEKLRDAVALWEAVRVVARATTRDRDQISADTKER